MLLISLFRHSRIMKDQIEETEDLTVPSIVLSTKGDVPLTIGEAVFNAAKDFWLFPRMPFRLSPSLFRI